LVSFGYPDLETVTVIAPKYAHALKGWDYKVQLPGVTIKTPPRDEAKQIRRDFERRIGAVEFRLGRHDRGSSQTWSDAARGLAVDLRAFEQAKNYLVDPQIRAQVLNHILTELPPAGRLVIIGHSLGSVIAADLLRRLPIGVEVSGMVSIGSPLANGRFDVDKLRETLKEPPTNLAWWVNFWNVPDVVAAHRGVSSVFPWMIDFRIDTKQKGPRAAHAAVEYLANEAVAAAVGFALFGSRSKELARVERGLDIPLDGTERIALLALRYAYLVKEKLEGDVKDRYAGALRTVQATEVDRIKRHNDSEGRALPAEIARLIFDLSDPGADVPDPRPSPHMAKEEAAILFTILESENLIRPFEVSISREKRRAAMEDLTVEMGLGRQFGTDVFAASKLAQEALSGGRGVNWIKWGALGVGAAAIVVATGGLALAAAPGVAGAAMITSALASFGPGGMIGGLLTAGTLITAGGGGIAFGLASPGTSAETLEAVIERRLAAEILRHLQGLEQDVTTWRTFVEIEIEVRREYERLDEFSDVSAPALKELKRKIAAVERALTYLRDHGLEPGFDAKTADDAD